MFEDISIEITPSNELVILCQGPGYYASAHVSGGNIGIYKRGKMSVNIKQLLTSLTSVPWASSRISTGRNRLVIKPSAESRHTGKLSLEQRPEVLLLEADLDSMELQDVDAKALGNSFMRAVCALTPNSHNSDSSTTRFHSVYLDNNLLVATNGRALSFEQVDFSFGQKLLLPSHAALRIQSLCSAAPRGAVASIGFNGEDAVTVVQFQDDMHIRLFNGRYIIEYMEWQGNIPREGYALAQIPTAKLASCLRSLSVVSQYVFLKVDPGSQDLILESDDKESFYCFEGAIENQGTSFNAKYQLSLFLQLMTAVESTEVSRIELQLRKPSSPLRLRAGRLEQMLMPMRY